MDILAQIQAFLQGIAADQGVTAIISTAVVLTTADLVTGVGAAARQGTFQASQVAKFIQSHVIGRVLPIASVAFLGHFEPALMVLAGLAATAYTAETLGSIRDSLSLPPAQAGEGAVAEPTDPVTSPDGTATS